MTSDDTPETLLKAVRGTGLQVRQQAGRSAGAARGTCAKCSSRRIPPPIEVISARPEWVELLVPCTREAAERIGEVMAQLGANLAPGRARIDRLRVPRAVAERGRMGRTPRSDLAKSASPAFARSGCSCIASLIPGPGFNIEDLPHAAIGYESGDADRPHASPRGKGHPPRRLRPAHGPRLGRRAALQREAERSRVRQVSRLKQQGEAGTSFLYFHG